MSDGSASADTVRLLSDKIEIAETVARFFNAMQHFHCYGTDWDVIDELIADEMTYLSSNFLDTVPKPHDEFMVWFKDVQGVHSRPRRGSFYSLSVPVVSVNGDVAHLTSHLILSHWLGPAAEHATWFYGQLDVDLVRTGGGWKITRQQTQHVRSEGHEPPVNYLHPDLEVA